MNYLRRRCSRGRAADARDEIEEPLSSAWHVVQAADLTASIMENRYVELLGNFASEPQAVCYGAETKTQKLAD